MSFPSSPRQRSAARRHRLAPALALVVCGAAAAGNLPAAASAGNLPAGASARNLPAAALAGNLPAAATAGPGATAPAAGAPDPAAGGGAPLRLTLGAALARARAVSAHLSELRSLTAAAGAGLTGARAERLPQLDVSAGYTRQSDVPQLSLDLPGVGFETVFPNIPDSYRGHLGLALPVYTGGRIGKTVTASAMQLDAANQDVVSGHADLALETTTAYWSLATARDSARVLTASLADFDAHLKEAHDRQDAGLAASNEVLAVEVRRDQAELARLQAASAADVANANLLRLLDLPAETRIEPTEPMAEPPPGTAAAAGSAWTDGAATPQPAAEPLTGNEPLAELISAAVAARPEIAALRSRIAGGRASAAAARAALRPQASLAAGYDYDNPNPHILPLEERFRSSWSVGATVSLSLFDGGRTAAAAAQIDAQTDALGHRLEDLERRVRLEVTQRLLELATARRGVVVAAHGRESAREDVRVARDRYQAGVIPSSELLDAETALLRAGLDLTNAMAQVRLALANLDRAAGR